MAQSEISVNEQYIDMINAKLQSLNARASSSVGMYIDMSECKGSYSEELANLVTGVKNYSLALSDMISRTVRKVEKARYDYVITDEGLARAFQSLGDYNSSAGDQ